MPARTTVPERLVRVTTDTPTIDKDKRTIRNVVMTRKLARDGGIVLPDGIIQKFFEKNPVVQARHGLADDSHSPVIGRSLGIESDARGMVSTTQFADTELGREYAYLYGLNDADEVYMRAWSFGWSTLKLEWWDLRAVEDYLGEDWEPEVVDFWLVRVDEVWVSTRSEMHEYSAVPVGADRDALSRAFNSGVRSAGAMMVSLDVAAGRAELAKIETEINERNERNIAGAIRELSRSMQAIGRDGATAADNGDSVAILEEIRNLTSQIKGTT